MARHATALEAAQDGRTNGYQQHNRGDIRMTELPVLRVHEKFWLALDQFQKMLADLEDPRSSMRTRSLSIETNYRTPPGADESPPDAPRVRCSNHELAEHFGQLLNEIDPLQSRAVRYHFMISSYSQYTEEWPIVANNEAKYFKTPVFDYIKLIQSGVDSVSSRL